PTPLPYTTLFRSGQPQVRTRVHGQEARHRIGEPPRVRGRRPRRLTVSHARAASSALLGVAPGPHPRPTSVSRPGRAPAAPGPSYAGRVRGEWAVPDPRWSESLPVHR